MQYLLTEAEYTELKNLADKAKVQRLETDKAAEIATRWVQKALEIVSHNSYGTINSKDFILQSLRKIPLE